VVEQAAWAAYLRHLGITTERHIRLATEGALVASLLRQGVSPELVILSDAAGQFKVAGFSMRCVGFTPSARFTPSCPLVRAIEQPRQQSATKSGSSIRASRPSS